MITIELQPTANNSPRFIIDKLKLITNIPFSQEAIQTDIETGFLRPVRDRNYRQKFIGAADGLSLGINNYLYKNNCITLNPAQYSNFREVLLIAGSYFDVFLPEMLRVVRLDIAIDLDENIEALFRKISPRFYRKSNVFRDVARIESAYFGRYPKVTVLYNDHRKHSINQSRLEKRFFNRQIPFGIETLEDLYVLPFHYPFGDIEILEVSEVIPKDASKWVKHKGINTAIKEEGVSYVKKKLNRDGQFNKRYGMFFNNKPRIYDLRFIYEQSMTNFFI